VQQNPTNARRRVRARCASGHIVLFLLFSLLPIEGQTQTKPFHLMEAGIQDVQDAYKSGRLTARQLVQLYLNRIEAYDKKGPSLNAVIAINPQALQEADRLDNAFKTGGTRPEEIPVWPKRSVNCKYPKLQRNVPFSPPPSIRLST
jgi:hypothetical protein